MAKIKTKRERVKFASDNVAGACPEVLDAILKANDGDSTPYGNDQISTELQEKFSEIFEKDVNIEATTSDEKIYKRVLQTKYRGLKNIYSYGIPAARMVSELAFYMKNKGDNYADRARKANREIYPA